MSNIYTEQNNTKDFNIKFNLLCSKNKEILVKETLNENYILFILRGSCIVSYDNIKPIMVKKSSFVLIPQQAKANITICKKSQILKLPLRCYQNNQSQTYINKFKHITESIEFQFKELKNNVQIEDIIKQVVGYIANNSYSDRIFEIKQEEFLFCLINYYTKTEVANLLYPILECRNNFREFVINNYEKVHNISELVQLSAMCRTYFYQQFKKEFNMTAKQWMLKQKVKLVKQTFAQPGICIKDIVRLYNFPSSEYLHKFCKQHFDATPSEMIVRYQSKNQTIILKNNNLEKRI